MKGKKIASSLIAVLMLTGALTACSSKNNEASNDPAATKAPEASTNAGGVDTSKEAKLVYYLWGSEGVQNKAILAEINKKLKADLNATIEVKYIDWPDINTKYPLLFASGEQFDMSHASPGAPVSYFTLASEGALVDLTDMLDKVAPKLKAEIPASVWENTKYKGKIYGVPSLYSEYTPNGYAYRVDLLKNTAWKNYNYR